MKTVLSIAGTDPTGGAGSQADIKTMVAHKVYGMNVVTSVVAQNTTGVFAIQNMEPFFIGQQMDAVFTDINPDAIKIGMVSTSPIIHILAEKLRQYHGQLIVLDPVMVSTSGGILLEESAIYDLIHELMPLATIITPNIPEAEILIGKKIETSFDMEEAAKEIAKFYLGAILIKGGHDLNDANDLLYVNGKMKWIYGQRINNPNTHGTGCTLSSAIASNLAKGFSLEQSVIRAKYYVSGALKANLVLGKGKGPLDHCFRIDDH